MCGIVGYIGTAGRGADPAGRAAPAGVSRLRFRRDRRRPQRRAARSSNARAGFASSRARSAEPLPRVARHRAHALGDAWRAERSQRASAHRRHSSAFAIVHNGIIENAEALRAQLAAEGVVFTSETDTEVLAHLIAAMPGETLVDAVRAGIAPRHRDLRGRGDRCGAAGHDRRRTQRQPGRARHRRARDVRRLRCRRAGAHTRSVVHLDDGEIAVVRADGFETSMLDGGTTAKMPLDDRLDRRVA